ncbi:hypothetical protein D3C71_1076080 [compost metagenome]
MNDISKDVIDSLTTAAVLLGYKVDSSDSVVDSRCLIKVFNAKSNCSVGIYRMYDYVYKVWRNKDGQYEEGTHSDATWAARGFGKLL